MVTKTKPAAKPIVKAPEKPPRAKEVEFTSRGAPLSEFEAMYETVLRAARLHGIEIRNAGHDASQNEIIDYVVRALLEKLKDKTPANIRELQGKISNLETLYEGAKLKVNELIDLKTKVGRESEEFRKQAQHWHDVAEQHKKDLEAATVLLEASKADKQDARCESVDLKDRLEQLEHENAALVRRIAQSERHYDDSKAKPPEDLPLPVSLTDYPSVGDSYSEMLGELRAYREIVPQIIRGLR